MTWTADGSALSDHADFVRVLTEGGGSKRGFNATIPYRDGEYSDGLKFYTGADVLLEVGIKKTDAFTHLSELQKMLGKSSGLVTLQRTDRTNAGTIVAEVELLAPPVPTQDRFTYLFPLRNPKGVWKDASWTSASGTAPSVSTSGDRPIHDAVVTFSAPGTVTHVDSAWGTSTIEYSGTGTAIVDIGARTITKAGAAQDAFLAVSQPWWLRLREDSAQTITATASVTIDWKNSWA
jgi:hypothetical protein